MASITIRPESVQEGSRVLIAGEEWPLDAIELTIDDQKLQPGRVVDGSLWQSSLVPNQDGAFLIEVSTRGLKGSIIIRARSMQKGIEAKAQLLVEPRVRPEAKEPRPKLDKPYLRMEAIRRDRTAGDWPRGASRATRDDWERKFGGITRIAPVRGMCNWVPLGPAPYSPGRVPNGQSCSGRLRAIAINRLFPGEMFVGTASGGLWRSRNGGRTFEPLTDDRFSLAVCAIAIDPNLVTTIYAGTGEPVPFNAYAYYGRGVLKSINSGDTWTELGAAEFDLAEIARIVVNPRDSANVYVAASNGLWESVTGGTSWRRLHAGVCTDVVLVQNPATPGAETLLAGFAGTGVMQATRAPGAAWPAFAPRTVTGAPAGSLRIVFGVCRTRPNVMYAAFAAADANRNLAFVARSDDWGSSWSPRNIPIASLIDTIYSPTYNLAIQPHPVNPDIVLLAVSSFYKSIDGGNRWTNVTSNGRAMHVDCHAIAFHPSIDDRVYAGCDGGLFVTNDLCATWESRNLDLGTLQLYDVGQHRDYESIVLVGAQDNGAFRYTGAPIWKSTSGGDGVVAQIDPHDPLVYYSASAASGSNQMSRSDDGGRSTARQWGRFVGTDWWIPFAAHPLIAGLVFQGARALMVSGDRGNTWVAATADLPAPVRSIAFHPTNPRLVYVGTNQGHVFRLTGPASGPWNTSTVAMENITLAGLPPNIPISSLAVDTTGTVWATSSWLLETEGTGEFTNAHVFRLDPGAIGWATKANGLVVANPINTIVIDPADDRRVFCGGDRGVFAWDHPTQTWRLMDEGLPGAPVYKLVIHRASRKLRAATFGRGVWERPVDGFPFTDYFLYFRDNLVDSGNGPSRDNVPHPFIAGERCWHWQSEDIVVDPMMQTPRIVTDPLTLYDSVVHLGARRGANRVYVTVHNKGPFTVTDVQVRVYLARASGGLPPFPSGLLAAPFTWTPPVGTTTEWTPVDAFPIGRMEAGTTRLAYWDLVIPPSAPRHSCLLAFTTSREDPYDGGGITNPDQLVMQNRKVTLRNLDLEAPPPSSGGGASSGGGGPRPPGSTEGREIALHPAQGGNAPLRLFAYCANVPAGAVIVVAVERKLRGAFRDAGSSNRVDEIEKRYAEVAGELPEYDFDDLIVRDAKSTAEILLGEAYVDRPLRIVAWLFADAWEGKGRYGFDLVQVEGEAVIGGYSVRIG